MRILLDSSVFISFFNDTDVFHLNTVNYIKNLLEDKKLTIIMPALVFLEVAYVLTKQLRIFDEEKILTVFAKYERIPLTFSLIEKILPFLRHITLKTSDAALVAIAKYTDATLITWDEQLLAKAGKFVKTQTPIQLLS